MDGHKYALLALELLPATELKEKEVEIDRESHEAPKILLTHLSDNDVSFNKRFTEITAQLKKLDEEQSAEEKKAELEEGDLWYSKYRTLNMDLWEERTDLARKVKCSYTNCYRLADRWQVTTEDVVDRWKDDNFHLEREDSVPREVQPEVITANWKFQSLREVKKSDSSSPQSSLCENIKEYIEKLQTVYEVYYSYPVGTTPNTFKCGGRPAKYFSGVLYRCFPWQS